MITKIFAGTVQPVTLGCGLFSSRLKDALGKLSQGVNLVSYTGFKVTSTTKRRTAKVSYIPFERNQRFVGQKKILKELDAAFGGHPPNQEVALYGLGGIGYLGHLSSFLNDISDPT